MKKWISIVLASLILVNYPAHAVKRYGHQLCKQAGYFCHKVKRGQSWRSLFPNIEERDIVRRLNRINLRLYPGMVIAIPKNLSKITVWDIAPFPHKIPAPGKKTIVVSQKKLAWGAFNPDGELVWWGPISSGRNYCPDVKRNCQTVTGAFKMFEKRGSDCVSNKYPVRRYGQSGGAKMPFCMFFFKGYAMHGSHEVPGYRASHGCIRLFWEDAKWLNHDFVEFREPGVSKGTDVVVEPLD